MSYLPIASLRCVWKALWTSCFAHSFDHSLYASITGNSKSCGGVLSNSGRVVCDERGFMRLANPCLHEDLTVLGQSGLDPGLSDLLRSDPSDIRTRPGFDKGSNRLRKEHPGGLSTRSVAISSAIVASQRA